MGGGIILMWRRHRLVFAVGICQPAFSFVSYMLLSCCLHIACRKKKLASPVCVLPR